MLLLGIPRRIGDLCDRLDLDELVRPAEHGHPHQRARRLVVLEGLVDDVMNLSDAMTGIDVRDEE